MSLKIVIIGVGEVGYNLSKFLSKEDYDITVVDINEKKCSRVKNTIDANVIHGNGASQRVLEQIDMDSTDYFLALTPIDEMNLIASKIAKSMGAKRVIARLRNTEFSHSNAVVTPNDFDIDYVSYPEKAAQKEIESLIRNSSALEVIGFNDESITLVGIKLETSSPLIGRTVVNVNLANPFIEHSLVLIQRNDKTFIPHNNSSYKRDDVVYFICKTPDVDNVQKMTGKPTFRVKNVMILGCGKIGRLLSKSLQYDYNVKMIEKDKEKANKYGPSLSNALLLVGDGLDAELLESENINEVDCFIAATEDEQTNIMSSLLVKDYGVKQIIIHISTTSYIKPIRRMGIDAIVSKNISAVNETIKFIQTDHHDEVEISRFEDMDIDSVEIKVSENSKYLRKKYNISDLPEILRLGAIIRGHKVLIPNLNTIIHSNDKLLFFLKPEHIEKVEDLFQ
tara:strand:+ start:7152 stop:8504 length:1353 start_codon:yes stop_codon:yes gene_type:complete